ncbi:hypothetical protein HK096_003427, partial [Nowakowskiella sp. JEL0078]
MNLPSEKKSSGFDITHVIAVGLSSANITNTSVKAFASSANIQRYVSTNALMQAPVEIYEAQAIVDTFQEH